MLVGGESCEHFKNRKSISHHLIVPPNPLTVNLRCIKGSHCICSMPGELLRHVDILLSPRHDWVTYRVFIH
jgi:hypothetical protein